MLQYSQESAAVRSISNLFARTPWRPPLIVLWLGWKIVLPLCGFAAAAVNFRQLIRHEFTVWLAFLPLFLLLNLLLLISAAWLARRRFSNRKTRLIAAVL